MATKAEKEYLAALSKAGKKNHKLLVDAGIELVGDESEAQLEQLVTENNLGSSEEEGPEEIDGVANSVNPTFETVVVNNKEMKIAVYAVHPVTDGPHKGSHVLYNEKGQRVSPPMSAHRVYGRGPDDPRGQDIKSKEVGEVSEHAYIAKACAASNAHRRARRLPNDPA